MVLSAKEPVQRELRHKIPHTARLTFDLFLTTPKALQSHAGVLGKNKVVLNRSATLITRAVILCVAAVAIARRHSPCQKVPDRYAAKRPPVL
jgi:hypothetical protein